jgi:hypothetical protein
MKKPSWYVSIILFIIAITAVPTLSFIGLVFSLISHPKGFFNHLFRIALSLDQTGNTACARLFNVIMIKEEGYKFGNIDETASSAFGKNEMQGTLTLFGRMVNGFLNWIDPGHSLDSIELNP